jgi:predicted nucleic acid-binding protein
MNGSAVVDTSLIVDVLTNVPHVATTVASRRETMHAPLAIDAEFLNVLRNLYLHRRVNGHDGIRILDEFRRMPIVRHRNDPLLDRAWELRNNVAAYDAMFVALAERLDVPLLTRDRRLSRSTGHSARIEFIE